MENQLTTYVHINKGPFTPKPVVDSHMIMIPQTDACLLISREGAYALRDALNEILEGVPVPPEDDKIGLSSSPVIPTCINHPNLAAVTNLDNENLCQECANAWTKGEAFDNGLEGF